MCSGREKKSFRDNVGMLMRIVEKKWKTNPPGQLGEAEDERSKRVKSMG